MTWPEEARDAIAGSLVIVTGDDKAFGYFNLTEQGFWRSFAAIVIVAPMFLYASMVDHRMAMAEGDGEVAHQASVVMTLIGLAVQWVAWPVIMVPVAKLLVQSRNYARYITVYNWSSILVMAIALPPFALYHLGLAGAGTAITLAMITLFASFWYRWMVARMALETSGPASAMLVIADTVISFAVAGLIG